MPAVFVAIRWLAAPTERPRPSPAPPHSHRRTARAAGLLLGLLGLAAIALTGPGAARGQSQSATAADDDAKPEAASGLLQTGDITAQFGARLFFLGSYEDQQLEPDATMNRQGREALALAVDSARAEVDVAFGKHLELVLELDMAGRVSLRDGYLDAHGKRAGVRVGQFKMPISAFHLESPWKLPLARRGILHDLLSDHLLLSGRRQGLAGRLEGGGFWDPALTVGVFQSVIWGPDAGDPADNLGWDDQTVVGRFSVTPAGVEVAAVLGRRVTIVLEPRGFWMGGLDVTGDFEFSRTGLRFWAEAYAGESWLSYLGEADRRPTFLTARALAAFRWGGRSRGTPYLELFATAGYLEPDTDTTDDLFVEVMAGVNLGAWRHTRLGVQVELADMARNFPRSTFLAYGKPVLASHLAAVLFAGAAF